MTTFTIDHSPSFVVNMFINGEHRCHQPWNINGTPWQSEEQAKERSAGYRPRGLATS